MLGQVGLVAKTMSQWEYDSNRAHRAFQKLYPKKKVCELCGTTENITIHHALPRSVFPERMYEATNMVLLCQECHSQFHRNCSKFCRGMRKANELQEQLRLKSKKIHNILRYLEHNFPRISLLLNDQWE